MKFTATSITLHSLPKEVRNFNLDLPATGITYNGHELSIAGWAYAQPPMMARSISIMSGGNTIKWVPLIISRPDVSTHLNAAEGEDRKFGFHTWIGALGLEDRTQLDIVLHITNSQTQEQRKVTVASIHSEKQAELKASSTYQPLLLTALGRSGTTLTMQALSEHPQILTANFYPYELRQATYWLSLLKTLNDPADYHNSTTPTSFERKASYIGHNPFRHPEFLQQLNDPMPFNHYYTTDLPNKLSRFVVDRINEFYDLIAAGENKTNAVYFAEKVLPSPIQAISNDLFTAPKEVILTRDFRDIICSAQSFNNMRNGQCFSRAAASDSADWIGRTFKHGAANLANSWRSRSATALHVRYEDLIRSPFEQIHRIFEYLNIEHTPVLINSIVRNVFVSVSHPSHVTAASPELSISRWERDLPDDLIEHCNTELADELKLFGYL
ncbi:MAG: sulfotransferase family protein [Pseudomonas sp.]